MQLLSLNGAWKMRQAGTDTWHDAVVPGSVYADLMRDGTLPDPFWRENEHLTLSTAAPLRCPRTCWR